MRRDQRIIMATKGKPYMHVMTHRIDTYFECIIIYLSQL